jgi:hypothetical protein
MIERGRIISVADIINKKERNSIVSLHVAPYFRVKKDEREIINIFKSHNLPPLIDPVILAPEVEEELYELMHADRNSMFTFPSKRIVLGHTSESILVPANMSLAMREFFRSSKTGQELPLTTNWGASSIHPGSMGPQTYEVYNSTEKPITVNITDLICELDVEIHSPSITAPQKISNGRFNIQKPGEIKLGNIYNEWEAKAIRRTLKES